MKSDKNIREGYKKTAVGVIPEEWEVKKLGDIGKVINGLTYSPKDVNDNGTLVLRSSNIQNRALCFNDNVFVNTDELQYNPVKKGDILICVRNGSKNLIGKNTIITESLEGVAFGAFMSVYRSNLYSYIFQFFGTDEYQRQINRNLGATINSINNNELRDFNLPIPPLPEQQAIANCLTTWDSGIEKLTQLIAAKREQKKGLMQQLLTGKKRLDGFVGEWKEVKLDEIAKRVTRKNKELNDTVITISAQRGLVLQEDFFNKRVASATLSNYYLLHKGEFAYNKSYSKGYPMGAFKRLDDFEKAVVTTLYICFKIKDNVNSDFLMDFFEAGLMVNNLMRIAQEGGRAHGLLNIGLADFFNLKLNIPSLEEQTAIAHILTTADQEISLLEEKLAAMKKEKMGLMQVLLTGEKRLVDN